MTIPLALAVAGFPGGVRPAAAQEGGLAVRTAERSVVLANLDIGDVIRVRIARATLRGSVASVGTDCLFLVAPTPSAWIAPPCAAHDSGSFAIPFVAIEALQLRGTHAGRGAAIGALIGGLGLGLYGVGIATGLDGPSDTGEAVEASMLLGGLGALSGALAGALVGQQVPRWKEVYP